MATYGRIYKHPFNDKEIWINVGDYNHSDQRIFPEYESWMTPHITEARYNYFIELLKLHLPDDINCTGWSAMLCLGTCGLCFCWWCYLDRKETDAKRRMCNMFHDLNREHQATVSLRFKNETIATGVWMDSNGLPAHKPPSDVSIVLKLLVSVPWPANKQSYLAPPHIGALGGLGPSNAPPYSVLPYPPPPVDHQGIMTHGIVNNSCAVCGKNVAGASFCSSCGAAKFSASPPTMQPGAPPVITSPQIMQVGLPVQPSGQPSAPTWFD